MDSPLHWATLGGAGAICSLLYSLWECSISCSPTSFSAKLLLKTSGRTSRFFLDFFRFLLIQSSSLSRSFQTQDPQPVRQEGFCLYILNGTSLQSSSVACPYSLLHFCTLLLCALVHWEVPSLAKRLLLKYQILLRCRIICSWAVIKVSLKKAHLSQAPGCYPRDSAYQSLK